MTTYLLLSSIFFNEAILGYLQQVKFQTNHTLNQGYNTNRITISLLAFQVGLDNIFAPRLESGLDIFNMYIGFDLYDLFVKMEYFVFYYK